jgi:hypothetical protein
VIFRRREPIHRQLARAGSLELGPEPRAQPEPVDPGPHWGEVGIHGVPRPRRWDAVGSAEAPDLEGDELQFVALANGELVADEPEPSEKLKPLAQAVDQSLERPFRAEAVRRDEDLWAVGARRIQVAELEAPGKDLQLAVNGDERTLTVDGERSFGTIPKLDQLGTGLGSEYVIRARRVSANVWEVETSPL